MHSLSTLDHNDCALDAGSHTIHLYEKYVMNTYQRCPIVLVKGQGAKVWDINGKTYLDFLGGIAVHVLGHNYPTVVEAIRTQSAQLIHTSNLYYTQPAAQLAELLVTHGGLGKVFFCNSGAEANEGAIKLARKYQSRKGLKNKYTIVTATHSFHGRTFAALAATQKPEIQQGFGPLPDGFRYAEWNDAQSFVQAIDETVAAVLLEPVQGEGGVHCASIGFLQAVREACDRVGALLIFDEVQCGMGRCGTLFAYQTFQVQPDVVTLAKGIASGMPLGAVCATDAVAQAFLPGDHATTFGGNPVAVAAGLATLRALLAHDYPAKALQLGILLFEKLRMLQRRYPGMITDVRGMGLMIGVQLQQNARTVMEKCYEYGLLVNITAGNVLRLLPPYVITEEDIDEAVQIIEKGLISSITTAP